LQTLQINSGATAPEWAASPQSVLTATGDLLYASAANTLARLAKAAADGAILAQASGIPSWLAKGTALQTLQMNSGATAPEWAASAQSVLTAGGDLLYASAANTLARLAKGTAYQVLRMNSGATAPEWGTGAQVTSGTYTGDNTTDRTISLTFTPYLVHVSWLNSGTSAKTQSCGWYNSQDNGGWTAYSGAGTALNLVDSNNTRPTMTANGFIVSGTTTAQLNSNGQVYTYMAIG
jgi:hypothetical protein